MLKKLLKTAAILGGIYLVLLWAGISPRDLADRFHSESKNAASDTKALISGEYSERVARKLAAEAGQNAKSLAPGGENTEYHRELAAERERIMRERAEAFKQKTDEIMKADPETLKKMARDSAAAREKTP